MRKHTCLTIAFLIIMGLAIGNNSFGQKTEYDWYAPNSPKPLAGVNMPKTLTLLSGGSPTSTYSMAQKIYQTLLMKSFPDMVVRVIPGGTMSNVKSIQAGKYQFGMAVTPVLNWAAKGEVYFAEPMPKIKYLATLGEPVACGAFFVLKKSKLNSCKDLKNQRIVVGTEKSFGRHMAEAELKATGISFEDIKNNGGIVNYIAWSEGIRMMADGHIGAVYYSGTHPYSALIEINTMNGLSWVRAEYFFNDFYVVL